MPSNVVGGASDRTAAVERAVPALEVGAEKILGVVRRGEYSLGIASVRVGDLEDLVATRPETTSPAPSTSVDSDDLRCIVSGS